MTGHVLRVLLSGDIAGYNTQLLESARMAVPSRLEQQEVVSRVDALLARELARQERCDYEPAAAVPERLPEGGFAESKESPGLRRSKAGA
jgi:hypothetical protein